MSFTDQDRAFLTDVHGGMGTLVSPDQGAHVLVTENKVDAVKAELDALAVQVAKLSTVAALTPAQAQLLQEVHDAVARIEAALKGA